MKKVMVLVSALVMVICFTGCAEMPLMFSTGTNYGLDTKVNAKTGDSEFGIGYQRVENAVVPVTMESDNDSREQVVSTMTTYGPDGIKKVKETIDGLSTYGSFAGDGAQNGDGIGTEFATGSAAQRLAQGKQKLMEAQAELLKAQAELLRAQAAALAPPTITPAQ